MTATANVDGSSTFGTHSADRRTSYEQGMVWTLLDEWSNDHECQDVSGALETIVRDYTRSIWDIAWQDGDESGYVKGEADGYGQGYKDAEENFADETGGDPQGLDIIAKFVGQMVNSEEGRQALRYLSSWEESVIRRFAR